MVCAVGIEGEQGGVCGNNNNNLCSSRQRTTAGRGEGAVRAAAPSGWPERQQIISSPQDGGNPGGIRERI